MIRRRNYPADESSQLVWLCPGGGTEHHVFARLRVVVGSLHLRYAGRRAVYEKLCCARCPVQDLHKELEAAISKFHGTEDTILFPSCFDANAGLFEAP